MENRDYSTISPSAKWILLSKGHTNIPFALQTAKLIAAPEKFVPDFNNKEFTYWARIVHFENRYWSIDNLLEDLPVKNILEISSGYSFRGLNAIRHRDFHYIDTDLPEVIALKENFITELKKENFTTKGTLELLPLNVLDEDRFREIISHFPEGEIAIVNEGLLMYLNLAEKEKLCRIIHKVLEERGGYWITADVYIKRQVEKFDLKIDNKTKEFFEQHRIEENKFESFEEAEIFFKRMGFVMDKKAKVERSKLSALKYLMKTLTLRQLFGMRKASKIQATWRLKINKQK